MTNPREEYMDTVLLIALVSVLFSIFVLQYAFLGVLFSPHFGEYRIHTNKTGSQLQGKH